MIRTCSVPGLMTWLSMLFLILLAVFSCNKPEPKQLVPAFYYWKTTFQIAPSERRVLRQNRIQKLYVRYFDVDWDQATQSPVPKAVIRFAEKPTGLTVIPVIYITNQTLVRCPPSAIPALAENLVQKIRQISQQQALTYSEIQLDCDWSAASRENYFQLLREVKNRYAGVLSATIRLHQIKYPEKTGVPPVERGMLMFYNMADWKRPDTRNSIYDLDVAGRYTNFLEHYSLPLDIVLPLFRWTAVYRNDRFLTLLNQVDQKTLETRAFLQLTGENRFVATRDTTAFGLSVRKGDLFRAEACSSDDLETGKALLLSKIQNQKLTFALYHLDSTTILPYSDAVFQSLFRPTP